MTAPAFPVSPALAGRLSGTPLLVMLDIDGTLAPIAPTPGEAAVPEETQHVLRALAARSHVHVALVSGRAAADARAMVGLDGVWVLGNHGMESIHPDGASHVHWRVAPYESAIAAATSQLGEETRGDAGVIVEDKRLTASVHYRLAGRAIVPRLRTLVSQVAARYGLRVTEGKEVLELRPPVHVNKGTALVELARELRLDASHASLLYAGDDRTDEDAFVELRAEYPATVTIRVGNEPLPDGVTTHAEFGVGGTTELRDLIHWMVEHR